MHAEDIPNVFKYIQGWSMPFDSPSPTVVAQAWDDILWSNAAGRFVVGLVMIKGYIAMFELHHAFNG